MTLLEECRALASRWERDSVTVNLRAEELRAIIARHEHDDWRGKWKCQKCGVIFDVPIEHVIVDATGHHECCGFFVRYERRKAERRRG